MPVFLNRFIAVATIKGKAIGLVLESLRKVSVPYLLLIDVLTLWPVTTYVTGAALGGHTNHTGDRKISKLGIIALFHDVFLRIS